MQADMYTNYPVPAEQEAQNAAPALHDAGKNQGKHPESRFLNW
jgi:hypothetical protein